MRILKTTLTFGLVLIFAASAWADVSITVTPSLAPNIYGSPSFDGYLSNAIWALENGLSSYGDPTLPTYYSAAPSVLPISDNIVTGFPSWDGIANPTGAFAAELGNRLHFGLDIKGNGSLISISELSFSAVSADPGDTLGFSYGTGSYGYSNSYEGIIYGTGGAGDVSEYTYVTSGDPTQLVNEIVGRGSGNAWASYSTDPGGTLQGIIDLNVAGISANANNEPFTFTGTYTLGDVSESATVTFLPVPEPISMIFFGTGLVAIGGYVSRKRMLRKA
jgi:hypothetical protein